MVLPRVFSNDRERVIASFNIIDIIQGQGIVKYYLFQGETDSDIIRGASNDSVKRSKAVERLSGMGPGDASQISDYDVGQFNAGATIEGTAYAQGSFSVIETSGSGGSGDVSIKVQIIKVSGGGETLIGEAESQSISTPSSLVVGNFLIPLTIPKTTFKAGDKLRFRVSIIKTGGASGVEIAYGIDPLNRDGTRLVPSTTDVTTTTRIDTPFKIDL